jgi:hypothetical protein
VRNRGKELDLSRGKKHTPEQVVNLLRQIEVAIANRKTTGPGAQESPDHGADFLLQCLSYTPGSALSTSGNSYLP